ncbi:MAG TPA: sigma-70 family RNA polymerase sigma factor [Gemmatimonadales bacterium]|nr:sigma-70 family RNA polymerase sigma factor [Gemmatimonadales bacterium]
MLELQVQAAERGAWFEHAIECALPDLLGAALRLAKNDADAEDLVADAVARAWMRLDDLKEPASFRGWVFRILTNCFISRRRAEGAAGIQEPYEEGPDAPAFSLFERLHQPFLLWWHNPEREFLNKLLREDLERAVDALPEAFRMVVVLADLQGFSYQEMAETLAIPDYFAASPSEDTRKVAEGFGAHAVVIRGNKA